MAKQRISRKSIHRFSRWLTGHIRSDAPRAVVDDPNGMPDPVDRAMDLPAGNLDASGVITLLESDEMAAHRRAVGWLVGIPTLDQEDAERVASVLLANLRRDDHYKKRIGMRGLRALHALRPDVVAADIDRLAASFEDYHTAVRHEAVETVAAVLSDDPSLAGPIYPYLTRSTPDHREHALRALVVAAGSQPAILRPLQPAIAAELEGDALPRLLLARAVALLTAADGVDTASLLDELLRRTPTGDPELDRTVRRVILQRTDWPPSITDRALPVVLDAIANDHRASHEDITTWFLGIVETDASVLARVETWAADRSLPHRRRVAVHFDELSGGAPAALLDALDVADDPFVSGVDPG